MDTIIIFFWACNKFDQLDYNHTQSFPYSEEKRNEIINTILAEELHVMLQEISNNLIISVDDKGFRQR
jgi:hypothetical protein